MAWCLPQHLANPFLEKLKSGDITPEKMKEMTSEQRHKYFSDMFGSEHGTRVNALLESKIILKDFQRGMVTWAKQVSGMKPEVQKDIVSRINKMEKILNPAEEKMFLEDLASAKLGIDVTYAEAKQIADLAKKAESLRDTRTPENRSSWIEYGNAVMDLQDYTHSLVPKSGTWRDLALNVAGAPQALMAGGDFSFSFRQGWGMMSTKEFWKGFGKQFSYAWEENNFKNLQAEIVGSPYHDLAKKAGLRMTELKSNLSSREEGMQSTVAEKIPVIGRIYRGGQRAFTGMANYVRFNRFVNLVESAKLEGRDVSDSSQLTKDLAKVVNDFTGSGNLGANDKYKNVAPLANSVFFSIRKLVADINIMNPYTYYKLDPFARKAALRQLIGSTSITVGVLGLARLFGADVETDSRSSDFGKIIIGDTRIDVTGGKANVAVLLSRLLTGKFKSTDSGRLNILGDERYTRLTKLDISQKFIRNKLAPIPSFVADLFAGSTAIGEPVETPEEIGIDALKRTYPMYIDDTLDLLEDEEYGKAFAATLLNLFGNSTSTYYDYK
jgi:hypothetical protein